MPKPRTKKIANIPPKKVKAEWQALKQIKRLIPEFGRSRTSNWEMIDAQVQVLEHGYTMEAIRRWWPDDEDVETQGAAEDALYWMLGNEIMSPLEMWKHTLPKEKLVSFLG